MHRDVFLPQVQMRIAHMVAKQGALQGGVVAKNHREGVEAENVAGLDPPVGHRVVGTIGVDPRLEPGPGVHQLNKGMIAGNLADHGVGRGHRHLIFGHAGLDRPGTGAPANIAGAGALLNQRDLLARLDRAHPHRGLANIDEFNSRQRRFKAAPEFKVDMVELKPQALDAAGQPANRAPEAVAAPIGIGEIVAEGAPPRLPPIDTGRYRRRVCLIDDHAIFAAKRAVQPA